MVHQLIRRRRVLHETARARKGAGVWAAASNTRSAEVLIVERERERGRKPTKETSLPEAECVTSL